MSRSAHAQSEYQLAELPKCRRCKTQLMLVMAVYDEIPQPVMEWECHKCSKVISKNKLPEPVWSEQDKKLHEWCEQEGKRNYY